MKSFFIYFGIFFLIFSIIGYKRGSEEVAAPGFLKSHVFEKVSSPEPIDGVEYFSYKLKDEFLFKFNVDTDTLTRFRLDKGYVFQKDIDTIQDKNLLDYFKNASLVAGGAILVKYSVKDLLPDAKTIGDKLKTPKGRGTILGIVFGAISGQAFGHWLATQSAVPSENSKTYMNILMTQGYWVNEKEKFFKKLYNNTAQHISELENENLKKQFELEQRGIYQLAVKSNDALVIRSQVLRRLLNLQAKVDPVYEKQISRLTVVDIIFRVILFGLLASALVLGFQYLIEQMQKKKHQDKFLKLGQPSNLNEAIKILSTYLSEKSKAKYTALSEEDFSKKNFGLMETANKTWKLDWEYLDDSEKAKIAKPTLLGYFSYLGIEKTRDVKKIISQSLHRHLTRRDINLDNQIQEIQKENTKLENKRNQPLL